MPPATVNQTFEVSLRAVPTQSLRARSKWDRAPGPSAATGSEAAATGSCPEATVARASRPLVKTAAANLSPLIAPSPRPTTDRRVPAPAEHSTGARKLRLDRPDRHPAVGRDGPGRVGGDLPPESGRVREVAVKPAEVRVLRRLQDRGARRRRALQDAGHLLLRLHDVGQADARGRGRGRRLRSL